MHIMPCPVCGRQPKITECVSYTDKRRRMCSCPNYDGILPSYNGGKRSFFIYIGEGDNNDIYKLWNNAIEYYNQNKETLGWNYKVPEWEDNPHIERR